MLSIQRVFVLLALAGCVLASLQGNAFAQDIPVLTEKQKSVILFDARVDRMVEDAKKYDGSEALENLPMEGPFEGIKFTDLKRVFGSASLPEDLGSVMAMAGGPPEKLPFDFFVRIEFNDAQQVEKFEANIAAESKEIEIGGSKYYVPQYGPPLALGHRVGEAAFEFGTADYCRQAKRNFFTDQLKAAYKKAADEPLRIAIDLESRAELVKEAVEMGKQQIDNPVAGAYLDLIDNAKSIVFTQSMASENLATLLIEGVNQADAEELQGGLESLLGIAKLGAPVGLAEMKRAIKVSDKSIEVGKTMVDDLKATIEGTTVSIVLKKPEGFEEAVSEFQTAARAQAKAISRQNDFRQLGLSALNYESAHMEFPYNVGDELHEDFSWRVRVLPFLEQSNIYDQIDAKKGPEDKANSELVDKMPKVFGADGKNSGVSWVQSEVKGFADITDGSSNTIMLIENPNAGPWLKNTPFTADDAMKLVSNLKDGEKLIVVLYDCSTHTIDNKLDKETLKNLLDPKDGNVVEFGW